MTIEYDIEPVAKPRMTRSDKWRKRPIVEHYRAFVTECRLKRVTFADHGAIITFVLPMPDSWSDAKKDTFEGTKHFGTPDLDNLMKALSDAVYSDDSCIWDYRVTKLWGRTGKIIVEQ